MMIRRSNRQVTDLKHRVFLSHSKLSHLLEGNLQKNLLAKSSLKALRWRQHPQTHHLRCIQQQIAGNSTEKVGMAISTIDPLQILKGS
jgi:hypothetical protein